MRPFEGWCRLATTLKTRKELRELGNQVYVFFPLLFIRLRFIRSSIDGRVR